MRASDGGAHGVLLSIHDVTPAMEGPVRELWALCRSLDVVPALLVVPDWHGAWPLARSGAFVEWIRACRADGAEIVLHGERHDEAGLPRTLGDSLRAVGRTAREGEFLTLNYADAAARIARGVTLLASLQLPPIGFIAPAWLSREATHQAVADAGLHVSEDARGVHVHHARTLEHGNLKSNAGLSRLIDAPVVRWSARTATRAHASRLVAAARWRMWRRRPLVRIALHPQDLAHPVAAASVARELRRWMALRSAVAYGAL